MELDELKSLINERMERVHAAKSPADIAILLGKQTQSAIGKIKRSLIIEMIISIVFALACAAAAIFITYTSLRIYFAIFAFICILFVPVLYLLLHKTKKLSSASLPVKSNLQILTKLIREFIQRYFQLTMALIPVTLIIAFLLGYSDETLHNSELPNPVFQGLIDSPLKITLIVGYILIFSMGIYYFTRWYLNKLYGKYVEQLELLIVELEG